MRADYLVGRRIASAAAEPGGDPEITRLEHHSDVLFALRLADLFRGVVRWRDCD